VKTKEDVIQAFEKHAMCLALSVILIVPLDDRLPALPVSIMPTCNQFTKADMRVMWEKMEEYYKETVGEVFNYPYPLGVGSDGCSTRVSLQLEQMVMYHKKQVRAGRNGTQVVKIARENECPPPPFKCIKLSGTIKYGSELISKEGVYASMAPKGDIMWSVKSVADTPIGFFEIERRDRMNVMAILKLISLRTQESLATDPELKWTLGYFELMYEFRMMYFASILPIRTRIKYCGKILTHLFGWYGWMIDQKESYTVTANFLTMETFRDVTIACNTFINILRVVRDNSDATEFNSADIGSNDCELFFSGLTGWGEVEAMKRNATMDDCIRLGGNVLTLRKYEGRKEDGKVELKKRSKTHDPERSQMLGDEKQMMENKEKYKIIGEGDESLQDITDDIIEQCLQVGIMEAKEYLITMGAVSKKLYNTANRRWDDEKLFDYTHINYKKNTIKVNAATTQGAAAAAATGVATTAAPPSIEVGSTNTTETTSATVVTEEEELEEVDVDLRAENIENPADYQMYGEDADDLEGEEEGEDTEETGEEINDAFNNTFREIAIDPMGEADQEDEEYMNSAAIAAAEVMVNEAVEERLTLGGELASSASENINTDASQRKGGSSKFLIDDESGKKLDIRVLVAIISRHWKFQTKTKGGDVGRMANIKRMTKAIQTLHEERVPHEPNIAFFELNDFAAFHFFDEETKDGKKVFVKPRVPKVWIGKIVKILEVQTGNRSKAIRGQFQIGKVPDNVKVLCHWFQGDQTGANVFESRTFTPIAASERKHHKGIFSASIVFFTPRMTPLNDEKGSYTIDSVDALEMQQKYEHYNFDERTRKADKGNKRKTPDGEEDSEAEEHFGYLNDEE